LEEVLAWELRVGKVNSISSSAFIDVGGETLETSSVSVKRDPEVGTLTDAVWH
jgi:hypothetical protein